MIKLETKATLPSAVVAVELRSSSDQASICLTTDEIREQVPGTQNWETSKTKRKQVVTFIGADSSPCSLEGSVDEAQAVEIAAAFKVVLEVSIANELKAAYSAGRVSKAYTSLEVARVVEVWESASKCVWRAEKAAPQAGKEVDLTNGKVSRVA